MRKWHAVTSVPDGRYAQRRRRLATGSRKLWCCGAQSGVGRRETLNQVQPELCFIYESKRYMEVGIWAMWGCGAVGVGSRVLVGEGRGPRWVSCLVIRLSTKRDVRNYLLSCIWGDEIILLICLLTYIIFGFCKFNIYILLTFLQKIYPTRSERSTKQQQRKYRFPFTTFSALHTILAKKYIKWKKL